MSESADAPLSLAFMRAHPLQAARVLEALPPAAAAPIFDRVPARVGADVAAAMPPHHAALCLAELDEPRMLELLSAMGTQAAVALLRQLPRPLRERLIAGLPAATALASALLLGYADDSLGAMADPDVPMLDAATRVIDALDHLRALPPTHPLLCVADGQRRLAGVVDLAALLHAPAEAKLATLMRPPAAELSAHAALTGAATHPGWSQASTLPVVTPDRRLVGVLTRDALDRALQRAAARGDAGPPASLAALLAHAGWQAVSGLIGGMLSLLPGVPRVGPGLPPAEGGHGR